MVRKKQEAAETLKKGYDGKQKALCIGISCIAKNIEIIKDLNCKSEFNTYSNELKHVIINLIKNSEDILVEKKRNT